MAAPYKRLPGRGSGLMTLNTLWEGDDHLLYVESNRMSESYRRFYFRDIQSIVICQTKRTQITSGVLFFLTLVLGLGAVAAGDVTGIVIGTLAGLFLLFAFINLILGPSCLCTIQTAVQTTPVSSLHRVRTARKVLAKIQLKIAAAQTEAPTA